MPPAITIVDLGGNRLGDDAAFVLGKALKSRGHSGGDIGGGVAKESVVCMVVIDVVADAKAVIAGAIAPPYPESAAVAVTLIGIAESTKPLAAIAGGNNLPGILFSYICGAEGSRTPVQSVFFNESFTT